MKAAVLNNIGDTELEICDDVELGDLGKTEVLVKITHTGICHSDVSAMNGTIPLGSTPAVLGHEGAGIVEEVGDEVTNVSKGDHVVVAWSPPCGGCAYCIDRKQPNLCSVIQMGAMAIPHFKKGGKDISSMAGTGTFAEQMIVPQEGVVKIDENVPLDIASLIGCGVMTGVGASLNTAKVTPGSSVIVFGAGGVGIAAIQGARIAGAAEIVSVDLNPIKLDESKKFGATHSVLPDDLEAVKQEITGGEGFDFGLECIGNPVTMRATWDATRRGGTCCIVGVGRMEEVFSLSAFEIFYAEKILIGSYYGGTDVRNDFHRLLRLWKYGKLDLEGMISRRLPLEDINPALEALRQGEVVRQVIEF